MRKKSHVLLSVYLINSLDSNMLQIHRKAFIMGSILPDCKPSFVTTKHNVEETFDKLCIFINNLANYSVSSKKFSTSYCRKLGEVAHYVADYFTFPHNKVFNGTIKEHCLYEKKLKVALNEYINSDEIYINKNIISGFKTAGELCDYIIDLHSDYLKCNNSVESDCRYIVTLCHIVVEGIIHLSEENSKKHTIYI